MSTTLGLSSSLVGLGLLLQIVHLPDVALRLADGSSYGVVLLASGLGCVYAGRLTVGRQARAVTHAVPVGRPPVYSDPARGGAA